MVQHPRVVRPVAARLPRSNRPPEADAVLLPGSNRLGRRAATALPRRELPAFSRHPPARIAVTARPPGRSRLLFADGSGGCCPGRRCGSGSTGLNECVFVVTRISWQRCRRVADSRRCAAARVCHERGAGLSPCARNTIREAISRDTSSMMMPIDRAFRSKEIE